MFPFDTILTNRIHDLERTVEIITGANSVLTNELERSKFNEANLLEKIFNLTGVNNIQRNDTKPAEIRQPIKFGKKSTSWPQLKDNLELKAREEYWSNKKKEASSDHSDSELSKLEKDVIGE